MFDRQFVLEVYYGGYFLELPKQYVGGTVHFTTKLDADLMSYFEIVGIIKELGCDPQNSNIFHKMPNCDLDGGLRETKSDIDVVDMFAIHEGRGTIAVYVENMVVSLDGDDVEVVRGQHKKDNNSESESETDESERSERSINDSDFEYFADGADIVDSQFVCSLKLTPASAKLVVDSGNGNWEVGGGTGKNPDNIVINVDEVENDDLNTNMQLSDDEQPHELTKFFEIGTWKNRNLRWECCLQRTCKGAPVAPKKRTTVTGTSESSRGRGKGKGMGRGRGRGRAGTPTPGSQTSGISVLESLKRTQELWVGGGEIDEGRGRGRGVGRGRGRSAAGGGGRGVADLGKGRGAARGLGSGVAGLARGRSVVRGGRISGRGAARGGGSDASQMQKRSTTYGDVYFSSGPSQGSSNMPQTQQASGNDLEGYAAF